MKRIAVLIVTGLIATSVAMPVASQDREVEEVLVTARKKEEALQEVPLAVSAFDAAALVDRNIESVDDVARFTPGFSFSKAFGRSTERPVIRGQSNVLAGVQFGVEAGAAYFIDGIYYSGDIQDLDINEIARVEVIKGPQSALYGRNTYSGAINFVTKNPGDEFVADLRTRIGDHREYEIAGRIAGPATDRLGLALSARSANYDGEYRNAVTGAEVGGESSDSVSFTIDWAASDSVNWRTRLQYSEADDETLPLFLQPATQNNCFPGFRSLSAWPFSGSTNDSQYFCGEIQPADVALNTDATGDALPTVPGVPPGSTFFGDVYSQADGTAFDGFEREQFLLSTIVTWDLPSGYTLVVDGAYRKDDQKFGSDSDHSSVNWFLGEEAFFANTNASEIEDYSVEFRIDSPADRELRWRFGGFFYSSEDVGEDILFSALAGGPLDQIEDTRNLAAFGSVEYDFTPNLGVTVEGRWSRETKQRFEPGEFLGEKDFTNFTPRLTVDWQVNEDLLLYGVYAQGVKPGGFNGSAGAPVSAQDEDRSTYDQEESDNFEVGAKATMMGGRLALNGSLYFIDAEDVQLTTPIIRGSDPNAADVGALTSVATNQGSGEILGIELDARLLVNENWSLGGNYAWTDAEFTEGCDDFQWTLTSGGGVLDPRDPDGSQGLSTDFTGNGDCSIDGKQFPLTSEHQAAFFVDYDRQLNNGLGFFAKADVTYESERFVQVHNLAEAGAATLVGSRIGLRGDRWELALYGRNLTDEDSLTIATRWLQIPYFTFASLNVAPDGASDGTPRAFFGSLRRGRTFGLEFNYSFGN